MATQPNYAATTIAGSQALSATADTSYTAPTHAVTVLSAAPITVASVTTTSGSQQVTIASGTFSAAIGVSSGTLTQPWLAGMQVYGTGIPVGTTVLYVNGTNAFLSQAATASGTVSLTAVSNGIRVEEVRFVATGTSVAGMAQLYLYDTNGNYHPDWTQIIYNVIPSTTQVPFFAAVQFDNMELPPGWSLVASSFVASQLITVTAMGGSV